MRIHVTLYMFTYILKIKQARFMSRESANALPPLLHGCIQVLFTFFFPGIPVYIPCTGSIPTNSVVSVVVGVRIFCYICIHMSVFASKKGTTLYLCTYYCGQLFFISKRALKLTLFFDSYHNFKLSNINVRNTLYKLFL